VSVIIPTYNREAVIARAIESAFAQSYPDLEVVVVDDGSSDGTADVLAGFGDRICAVHQENAGPSAARNAGVRASRGEIVAFLDSDDTWRPTKIERQVALLERAGREVPCCVCNAAYPDADGGERPSSFERAGVMGSVAEGYWTNPAPILATRFILFNQVVAIRREAFERLGGFNEELRILEDYELAFRLSLLGPWAFIAEPLVEKHEDTAGIGVAAMGDPMRHARCKQRVLHEFLKAPIEDRRELREPVERALREIELEIRAVGLRERGGLARACGRGMLHYLRLKAAVRRRLDSWPRVDAVAELPAS